MIVQHNLMPAIFPYVNMHYCWFLLHQIRSHSRMRTFECLLLKTKIRLKCFVTWLFPYYYYYYFLLLLLLLNYILVSFIMMILSNNNDDIDICEDTTHTLISAPTLFRLLLFNYITLCWPKKCFKCFSFLLLFCCSCSPYHAKKKENKKITIILKAQPNEW